MNKSIIYGLLAIISTATAYFLGNGIIDHFGYLMWLAPLPVLFYSLYTPFFAGFWVTLIAFFLGNGLADLYFGSQLPQMLKPYFPVYPLLIGNLGAAIIFSLLIVLTVWLFKKTRHWLSIFFLPASWTAYEFWVAMNFPSATNGNIAYSQMHEISLIQIASITGIWGIDFLLMLIPAGIAFAWFIRSEKTQTIASLGIPFLLLAICLIFGWNRLHESMPDNGTITVGLAATNQDVHALITTNPSEIMTEVYAYRNAIQQLAEQGASVILLPEKILTTNNIYLPQVLEQFIKAAKSLHVTVIFGLNQPEIKRNTAVIITPTGEIKYYFKQHLIAFGSEAKYQPGNQVGLLQKDNYLSGITICHDLDFQRLGQTYAKSGINILFAPALDFVADDWQHARIAIMRGVEGGYPVVRAAQWGLLSVNDAYGRLISKQKTSLTKPVLLLAKVPLGNGEMTFYAKMGDWFAWVCVMLSVVLLGFGLFKNHQSNKFFRK